MYTIVEAKVWIKGDAHGEVMSDIGVIQGCPLSPKLFGLYINKTWNIYGRDRRGFSVYYLTHWFVFMLTMLFYSLNQEQAYKGFWTSYTRFVLILALKLILSKTKPMLFGCNKGKLRTRTRTWKLNQDKDQIEINHEHKYLGVDFYSHGYFESSSKRWRMAWHQKSLSHLDFEVNMYESFDEHLKKISK